MSTLTAHAATMQETTALADLPRSRIMFLDLLGRLRIGGHDRAELVTLLREPWRHYHGAGHAGLLWNRHLSHGGDPADAVAAHAIAYHDAIHAVGAADNEARSAALWRRHAAGLPANMRAAVERAILATADHLGDHADPDACWLVDLDLTPFGEPWPHFVASSRALREEAGLAAGAVVPGRVAFLRRLLALPRIYRSTRQEGAIGAAYEATARINLARVLA